MPPLPWRHTSKQAVFAGGLIHLLVAKEQRAADGFYPASRQSEAILTSF